MSTTARKNVQTAYDSSDEEGQVPQPQKQSKTAARSSNSASSAANNDDEGDAERLKELDDDIVLVGESMGLSVDSMEKVQASLEIVDRVDSENVSASSWFDYRWREKE